MVLAASLCYSSFDKSPLLYPAWVQPKPHLGEKTMRIAIVVSLLTIAFASTSWAADLPGSKDPSGFKRYEVGSTHAEALDPRNPVFASSLLRCVGLIREAAREQGTLSQAQLIVR